MTTVYNRRPLRVTDDGIPIFSRSDAYNSNYRDIADEHLEAFHRDGTNPFMHVSHIEALEAETQASLITYAPLGGSVLDAGVGLGGHLWPLGQFQRFGMDISLGYLRVAKSRGIDVCLSRIEDNPYPPESFDAVLCTDVLEHVLDLNKCVAQLLKVLKPGGVIIARVPRREHLEQYLNYKYRFVHLRIMDETMLTLLFDRVFGLEVLEARAVVDGAESLCVAQKPSGS